MVFKLPKLLSSYTDWLEKQQSSILSAATVITIANVGSALVGFVRTRVLIGQFYGGVDEKALGAFQVAFQIPDLMFQLLIFGIVSASFIPIFLSYKRQDEKEAFRLTSDMMNTLLLLFSVVAAVVFIFAEPITRMRTGHEFTPEQVTIAARLTQLMLGAQFFFGISSFLSGISQSYQRFVMPALAPIIYNLGIVLGVLLFAPQLGIYAAGAGVVLGAFLHMLIQLPITYKLGYRYRFSLRLNHPGIKNMFKMMPARTLTLGVSQFQQLALGFFATSVGSMSFFLINLAFQLVTGPIRFFGVPISQAAFPFLSAEAAAENYKSFRDILLNSIHQITFFALPASVLILILRVPIVRLAFGTGNFPWATTLETGRLVALISLSIAAQSVVNLLIRAFYALKNTRVPLYISLITVGIFIVMSWISVFVTKSGLMGLALATTVSNLVEMFLFLFFLNNRVKGLLSSEFFIPQLKMLIASFLMAVFLYLPFRILDELVFNTSRTVELILLTITTSTIGMLVYIYFAMLFDVRELYILQKILDKLGSWKKTLAKSQEVLIESPIESEEV